MRFRELGSNHFGKTMLKYLVEREKNRIRINLVIWFSRISYIFFKVQQASYYQQYLITFSNLSLMQEGKEKAKQTMAPQDFSC
jgi:hypothetical protein